MSLVFVDINGDISFALKQLFFIFQASTKDLGSGIRLYRFESADCADLGDEIDILPVQCQDLGTIRIRALCRRGQATVALYQSQDCSDKPSPLITPPEKICARASFGPFNSFSYECL